MASITETFPELPEGDEPRPQLNLFLEANGALGIAAAQTPLVHDVVEAPLDDSERRPLRTLRKANAAVHLYPVKGNYSLPMRRVFNALLALGHAKLSRMPADTVERLTSQEKVLRFETTATELKKLVGWEGSNNNENLYEVLDALQRLQAVWDVMDGDGGHWTEKATLLSQWGRTPEGRVRWLWTPDLFALLFDPANPYTPLDLALTRQFRSKYTLALFENVFRYRRLGHTPWRSMKDWKLLIAGSDRYDEMAEFKRTVLGTALKELKATPDAPVDVAVEERRGPYNRIEAMRFVITPRRQPGLGVDLPAPRNAELEKGLMEMGVKPEVARRLMAEHDDAYLMSQLALTRRAHAKKPLANPAGFLVRAIEERYREEVAQQVEQADAEVERLLEQRRKEALDVELQSNWFSFRRDEASRWWDGQLPTDQAELLQQFLDTGATPTALRSYRRGGATNKAFRAVFLEWVASRPDALSSPQALSFEAYKQSLGLAA